MAQKIQYYWQLDVYQLSVEAAMKIYELSKTFPTEDLKTRKPEDEIGVAKRDGSEDSVSLAA